MPRFHFLLLFLAFLLALCTALGIGLSSPTMLLEHTLFASEIQYRPANSHNGLFIFSPPPLSLFNKEFWISLIIHPAQLKADEGLFTRFNASLKILASGHEGNQTSPLVTTVPTRRKEMILNCYATRCSELILAHVVPIDFVNYVVYLQLDGFSIHEEPSIDHQPYNTMERHVFKLTDIELRFHYYNPRFTYLELVSRFVCFVLAELVTILFFGSLKYFSFRSWTVEQKVTAALLPLTMLFNNPFYPLRYFVSGCFPQLLDDVAHTAFLCAFLLVLLCVYHGLRVPKRRFLSFYLPKLTIVGVLWATTLSLTTWRTYRIYSDVTFDDVSDFTVPLYAKILFGVFGSMYLIFLTVVVLRAFFELDKLGYYTIRLRTFTALTLALGTTFTVSIALHFAPNLAFAFRSRSTSWSFHGSVASGPLTDPWNRTSCEFSLLYILTNTLLVSMAFMYSSSENAISEHHFKDNPSLSMINESDDEEVVFDSEDGSVKLCVLR